MGLTPPWPNKKPRARAAWAGSGEAADASIWFDIADKVGASEFLGYKTETAEGQVLALVTEGTETDRAEGQIQIITKPDAILRRIGRSGGRYRLYPHGDRRGKSDRYAQGGGVAHPYRRGDGGAYRQRASPPS